MKNILNKILISGVLLVFVSLFIAHTVKLYQEKTFQKAYEIQVQKISNLINDLEVIQDVRDFSHTVMYSNGENFSSSEKSDKFLNEFVGVLKSCGQSSAGCFAKKYYNADGKTEYVPVYEGSCAILKNGMSMCIKPQILNSDINGLIDLNGQQPPNIFGKDLRTFSIDSKEVKQKQIFSTSEIEVYREELD